MQPKLDPSAGSTAPLHAGSKSREPPPYQCCCDEQRAGTLGSTIGAGPTTKPLAIWTIEE